MVIQMEAETPTSLLSLLVQLALVHMVVLLIELLCQTWTLFLSLFHLDIFSHVFRKEVVIQIFLSPLQLNSYTVTGVKLSVSLN